NNLYIDSLDHRGVMTWRDTFPDGRSYHKVDLKDRITTKNFALDVYDQLKKYADAGATLIVGDDDKPISLDFEMPLKLKGINNDKTEERLDSAWIDDSKFTSKLTTSSFDIQWDWIDTVIMDLGDQITRPAGHTMVLYTKGDAGGFNVPIDTKVDHFTLNMMKNKNKSPQDYAVYDSTTFHVHFVFTIPSNEVLYLNPVAKLNYDFSCQFIDYRAIWGYFKPSKDMFAEVLADVGKSFNSLTFLRRGYLPFSDPYINVEINTKLAGNLRIDSCYVFAIDVNGKRTPALFNGSEINRNIILKTDYSKHPLGFLDPYDNSTIGDSIMFWTDFDKSREKGEIDRLFGYMPDKIGYKFKVDFDTQRSPQVRLNPNDSININAICTLPFIMKQGTFVSYPDTFHNIDLSKVSLDSLQRESELIDTLHATSLKLVLKAKNMIPLTVKAAMRCYDANDKVIMSPDDPSKPFIVFTQDTISFAPRKIKNGEITKNDEPGETTIIANLEKKDIDMLPKVKAISFECIIDDKALDYAYKQGLTNIKLTEEQDLTIKLGLTANVNAVLNFDKDNK
ncbi:MAG: hypothetical protein IKS76_00360, partial [Paludibacteraceae bacterium]|nr:hypothetical protein [Paludibacteraceae bacterium]